jgi:hypothetical protein
MVSNALIIGSGFIYWYATNWATFKGELFITGFFCGISGFFARVFATKATILGYAGIVAVITNLHGPILIIIKCI